MMFYKYTVFSSQRVKLRWSIWLKQKTQHWSTVLVVVPVNLRLLELQVVAVFLVLFLLFFFMLKWFAVWIAIANISFINFISIVISQTSWCHRIVVNVFQHTMHWHYYVNIFWIFYKCDLNIWYARPKWCIFLRHSIFFCLINLIWSCS